MSEDGAGQSHAAGTAPAGGTKRRRRIPVLVEVLLAVIAVAVVQAFFVKPFGVPSQSMENTLRIGDRILVNRLDRTIDRTDVIVFGHGATWAQAHLPSAEQPLTRVIRGIGDVVGIGPSNTEYTVKRVIGLPGEKVRCCSADGRVEVNGTPLDEPYVFENLPFRAGTTDCSTTPRSTRCFPEITVPKENFLVMGDHRSESADSVIGCRGSVTGPECARFVPFGRLIGPVVLKFWPLTEAGGIPH